MIVLVLALVGALFALGVSVFSYLALRRAQAEFFELRGDYYEDLNRAHEVLRTVQQTVYVFEERQRRLIDKIAAAIGVSVDLDN